MSANVVAFYGYKGGAGRSHLAANVAVALSIMDRKTLLIDWDLEAPGIGDFLDLAGGAGIAERWRSQAGVLDMLRKCTESPSSGDLLPAVRPFLVPGDANSPIIKAGSARFPDLLGPGRQNHGSLDGATDLMTTDWVDFFALYAERLHSAMTRAVAESGYDVVIIDTRTGFNLPTLFVLRYLAQRVYFVSPRMGQALEGVLRMWELLPQVEGEADPPERRLVLSRHKRHSAEAKPDDDRVEDDALAFIRSSFGADRPDYEFPDIPEISDAEQLIIGNSALSRYFFDPSANSPGAAVERARRDFWRICRDVAGGEWPAHEGAVPLSDAHYRETIFPWASALSGMSNRPQLKAGKALVDAALVELGKQDEAPQQAQQTSAPSIPKDQVQKSAQSNPKFVADVVAWVEGASHFNRMALRRQTAARDASETSLLRNVPELRACLLPDSDDGAESEKVVPAVSLSEADIRQRRAEAVRLRQTAGRLRDEGKPHLAIKELDDAIHAIGRLKVELKHSASVLREQFSAALDEDELIYLWERAFTLEHLGDTQEGLLLLLTVGRAHQQMRPSERISATDIPVAIVGMATRWLSGEPKPVDARLLEEATAVADRVARENQELAPDGEIADVVATFRLHRLSALEPPDERDVLSSLRTIVAVREAMLRPGALDDPWPSDLRALTGCLEAYALVCRSVEDDAAAAKLRRVMTAARLCVDRLLPESHAASSVHQVRVLETLLKECSRPLEALALCQDRLQLIGGGSDAASSNLRNIAIDDLSIITYVLGRPDFALATLGDQRESSAKKPSSEPDAWTWYDSSWWGDSLRGEMGQYEQAWNALRRFESEYVAAMSDRESAGDGRDRSMQLRAIHALRRVRSFLARIALECDAYDEAMRYAVEWQSNMEQFERNDISTYRGIAVSHSIQAMAIYAQGDSRLDDALSILETAARLNAPGARAFGSRYGLVQADVIAGAAEIRAFASRPVDVPALERALSEFEAFREELRPNEHTWFFSTRMHVATVVAVVAAVCSRSGARDRATRFAGEARDWASIPVDDREQTQWVTDLGRVPRAIAAAVLFKEAGGEAAALAAATAWRGLRDASKHRYRRIFEFCGVPSAS